MTRRRDIQEEPSNSLHGMIRPSSLTKEDRFEYKQTQNEIIPLDLDDKLISDELNVYKIKTGKDQNIKRNFFSMIDNVLGGGQSSTSQIAQNISMIQNNLSNVSCVSQQYS